MTSPSPQKKKKNILMFLVLLLKEHWFHHPPVSPIFCSQCLPSRIAANIVFLVYFRGKTKEIKRVLLGHGPTSLPPRPHVHILYTALRVIDFQTFWVYHQV